MTLAPSVVVHTLSGDQFVTDLFRANKEVLIFSWNGERVVPGRIRIEAPRLSVPLKLELDDGSWILASGTSRFLLHSGGDETLRELPTKTSLLPLYLRRDHQGYAAYREPGLFHRDALTSSDRRNWRKVSRMVAEWKLGRRMQPGDFVRYKDGDRGNSDPFNLEIEFIKPKARRSQKSKFAEPIFAAHDFIKKVNHKVEDVKVGTSREMFSIKGIGISNFAVGGVFVSVDVEV